MHAPQKKKSASISTLTCQQYEDATCIAVWCGGEVYIARVSHASKYQLASYIPPLLV